LQDSDSLITDGCSSSFPLQGDIVDFIQFGFINLDSLNTTWTYCWKREDYGDALEESRRREYLREEQFDCLLNSYLFCLLALVLVLLGL
jgi:hypothetical protein